ncbi:MAG: DUF5615 family PIN-like protein [Chloroflexi bacterium]|nr:DUF5615 family PIN-like protein [Chloroflexota bacterium]
MRFLLDSHLPRALAEGLIRHDLDAVELSKWRGGDYRSALDALVLRAAYLERRVLVSFDCRTIPPLLKELAEAGEHHTGVVFISSRTFRSDDVGGLLEALRRLAAQGGGDWEDVIVFLRRGQTGLR